jgi:hypothetical protein
MSDVRLVKKPLQEKRIESPRADFDFGGVRARVTDKDRV